MKQATRAMVWGEVQDFGFTVFPELVFSRSQISVAHGMVHTTLNPKARGSRMLGSWC